MPELEKFLFEVSFDEDTLAEVAAEAAQELAAAEQYLEPEEELPTFTEDQLDAARDEGFEAGRNAGINEAADAIETKINEALGAISGNLEELFKRQAIDAATTFSDAVSISTAIARKCFPYLNEAHGFEEIERMVKEVLTEVLEEPRVIIHINPLLRDLLEARMAGIAGEANFEGQVIILEAEDIAPGDCRVVWSSGIAERNVEGTISKIDQIVAVNLGSVKEEIADDVEENGIDMSPPPAPNDTEGIVEPTSAEAADLVTPTDVTESATPEIAVNPAEPAVAPEPAMPEQAIETASDPELDAPAGPPPTPSADILTDPSEGLETAESLDSEGAEDGNTTLEGMDEPTADTPVAPVFDDQPNDDTEAHLMAGPGSMEPGPKDAILETDTAPDAEHDQEPQPEADMSADTENDEDSMPPDGPNF